MIKGSIVALITPFKDNKEIDYDSINSLLDLHIKSKTDYLLLMGTTQESLSLSNEEKKELVKYVSSYLNGKIKLIVGLISNKREEVLALAKLYNDIKIEAYLVIGPYYTKTNISGLLKYFTYLADGLNHPIILYNVPKRCGFSIPLSVVEALSYHNNIIGIKDASGDIEYINNLISIKKESFSLYTGDDLTAIISLKLGFDGWINVIGNYYAKECKYICDNKSEELYYSLFPIIKLLTKEVSPISIKYLMYCMGLIRPNYRIPLDLPMIENRREIEQILHIFESQNM